MDSRTSMVILRLSSFSSNTSFAAQPSGFIRIWHTCRLDPSYRFLCSLAVVQYSIFEVEFLYGIL
jgi:hypothetical protein